MWASRCTVTFSRKSLLRRLYNVVSRLVTCQRGYRYRSTKSASAPQLHLLPVIPLLFKFAQGLGMFWVRRRSSNHFCIWSSRPQPFVAKQWAESFLLLMASKYGTALFREFLLGEFSHENLDFWVAVEIYKKSKPQKMLSKAQKIYDNFVAIRAPNEVNLDSQTRSTILKKIISSHQDRETFDQARKRIQHIMEQDSYARFLKSELFLGLIHPELYEKAL